MWFSHSALLVHENEAMLFESVVVMDANLLTVLVVTLPTMDSGPRCLTSGLSPLPEGSVAENWMVIFARVNLAW